MSSHTAEHAVGPYVNGIAIGGFRSFGRCQDIGPLRQMNIFVGQNNAGKSNILRFVHRHLSPVLATIQNRHAPVESFDVGVDLPRHAPDEDRSSSFGIGFSPARLHEGIPNDFPDGIRDACCSIIESMTTDSLAWVYFDLVELAGELKLSQQMLRHRSVITDDRWLALYRRIRGHDQVVREWRPQHLFDVVNSLVPTSIKIPEVHLVPALRQIRVAGENSAFDSENLISRLADLQSPEYQNDDSAHRIFESIHAFVRDVTSVSDARIQIPSSQSTINIRMNGRLLPLESLGTGIHQVIILASAAATIDQSIVCLEEPETHVHPILQRKLLTYLQHKTTNQYFVTTHAAHILDSPSASVFHVSLRDDQTVVERADSNVARSNVCFDLGYRPSDLMQTNCVIWVEGPSDRIYLRHWLSDVAPDLLEGTHYSIMFYGGRLLRHLTFDDDEIDEFVAMLCLNRRAVVLMDSDREKPRQHLGDTKKRVEKEMKRKDAGFVWVTAGREIENYVAHDQLQRAVLSVHPRKRVRIPKGRYKKRLGNKVDKVKVARAVTRTPPQLDILDLRAVLTRLVKFVRESNHPS